MNRISLAGAIALVLGAVLTAACGGGGGSKTPTATGAAGSSATIPGANTGGTSTTAAIATSTPVPTVSDADAAATEVASNATATALSSEDITGGDPDATPRVVNTIPAVTPKSGTTPVIDPTQIAPVSAPDSQIAYYIDLNASQPGIQATRDVNPGDLFQVGIVLANIPPNQNNLGGIAAFNFMLNYDKTKIVAPSLTGGPTTSRNPRLNLADLGGDATGWQCVPAAEGDEDDPGGISGDGIPETGQAFLSCYTNGLGPSSGTLTIATISFTAIASGTTVLSLDDVAAADTVAIEFADCGTAVANPVPCNTATVTVK